MQLIYNIIFNKQKNILYILHDIYGNFFKMFLY
jgi:hypothetical protein